MHNSFQPLPVRNHSTRLAHTNHKLPHSLPIPNPNKTGKPRGSLMDNAVTAAYTGTTGRNAENDFDKKVKTNSRTRNRKPQPSSTQLKNQTPHTTPNWFAKFAERWNTHIETVTAGKPLRQHTEASPIINSQRRKSRSSEGISNRPTIGSTIPDNK